MILSATFSKPSKKCGEILGKPYVRVRLWRNPSSGVSLSAFYTAEFFTATQSFTKKMTEDEVKEFVESHAGKTFKSVVERTENEEITFLGNRHGEVRVLKKSLKSTVPSGKFDAGKKYLLPEDEPVPFLIRLGVQSAEGKIISKRYDKFRQVNRFLEFISDIIGDVRHLAAVERGVPESEAFNAEHPLRVSDFGCGKSYLTFAVYHYLGVVEKIPVEITGLGLKKDVIDSCEKLAVECGYTGLHFSVGDVADFSYKESPDIVITLHACDTATDYALSHAVKNSAKAILSVPCCQHEINTQLDRSPSPAPESPFASLERFGIIREKMSALVTDAIRAELLEQSGYKVQVLEFIDVEHTPKNLLIRAVKKSAENKRASEAIGSSVKESEIRCGSLMETLGVSQKLKELLQG